MGGCTDDDQLLIKYLEAAIKPDSKIRRQDVRYVFSAVARNASGRLVAWFINNLDRITENVDRRSIRTILTEFPKKASTQLEASILENLLKERRSEMKSNAEHAEQSLDKIRANIKWVSHFKQQIMYW